MDIPKHPNCQTCGIVKQLLSVIKDLELIHKFSNKKPVVHSTPPKVRLN